ncbi:MAG: hypothetical protein ACYC8U_07310 [Thermoleophilia bacterium]
MTVPEPMWDVPRAVPAVSVRDGTHEHVTVRVASSAERLRLEIGACRRLDHAPVDRQILLAIAADLCLRPRRRRLWLSNIALMLAVPESLVWEVLVRHELYDDDVWISIEIIDPFEKYDLDDDIVLASDFVAIQLLVSESDWPYEFLTLAARRWPDDLCGVATALLVDLWDDEDGWGPASAVEFFGHLFECVETGWWMRPYFEGVKQGKGNLAERAAHLPVHRPSHRARRRAAVLRPLTDRERTDFFGRLARRLLAQELGDFPELVLAAEPSEWAVYGRLVFVLFKRDLPDVNRFLEERLFEPEGLFEFLGALAGAPAVRLKTGADLLYDMITGTEEGPHTFVETLRARRGWDLPQPLRRAVVQGLSLGLGSIVEVVATAEPPLASEVHAIIGRWREELAALVPSQAVGGSDC